MSQTMLAILALVLVSFFVTQQQRRVVNTRFAIIRNELAVVATGVAADHLEEIKLAAFDQGTRDTTRTSNGSLTLPGNFGAGNDNPGDDIDDFHNPTIGTDTVRVINQDTLRFRVFTDVRYATEADPNVVTTSRTKFKKVTARVVRVRSAGETSSALTPDTMYVSRTFACGSRCNW